LNKFSKTKETIFDKFVEMTSSLGYENVSMRDLANEVGIQVASIYNHFQTKAKILEHAYDYYCIHLYDNRNPAEKIKNLLKTASAEEIVDAFNSTFESEDQKKYVRMILITKIVYMRLYQDPIANQIFAETYENSSRYVMDVLEYGIGTGRIDPGFDVATFTDLLIDSKVIMGIKAFAAPNYVARQLEQEARNSALLARLLSTSLLEV
jgi:AcrR family transcriptional regulator